MASLEYLRECMEGARLRMDDPTRPAEERRAARAMFWHCEKRVGAMVRGGFTEDDPGHFMLGYSELGYSSPAKRQPAPTTEEQRRAYLDRKAEVQIAAREAL